MKTVSVRVQKTNTLFKFWADSGIFDIYESNIFLSFLGNNTRKISIIDNRFTYNKIFRQELISRTFIRIKKHQI